MNPLISIILPVYNGEKFLQQAIDSVLAQSYSNLELIIVNDFSTDRSLEISQASQKRDARVRIIDNEINLKLPETLNKGHLEAKGTLITWISDDNYFVGEALQILKENLFTKNVDVVYSDIHIVDENNRIVRDNSFPIVETNLFGNFIGACFLYKKEVFERNEGYDKDLFLVEDYDFWMRALTHSKFAHIPQYLYFYRRHNNTLTSNIAKDSAKADMWSENIRKMYRKFARMHGISDLFVSNLQFDYVTNKKIPFDRIVQNHRKMKEFKKVLRGNLNFTSSKRIDQVFLNMILNVWITDNNAGSIRNAFFIFRYYYHVLSIGSLHSIYKIIRKINRF